MGNRTSSGVTSGVKDQAAGVKKDLYEYVDLIGGGKLVDLMKKANRTKNYEELETYIKLHLPRFLYNNGEGKRVSVKQIVQLRAKDRGIKLAFNNDEHDFTSDKHTYQNGYTGK